MWFKASAVFVLCLFPTSVIPTPFTKDTTDLASLYARALTVEVVPFNGGDYTNLAAGRPHLPDKPAKGCPKAELKDWKKLDKKCKTWDYLNNEFKTVVTPRVVAALEAAKTALKLDGHIVVRVKSAYHEDKATDDLDHWTYFFSAPVCGAGDCAGHAYTETQGRKALIWGADHKQLFKG